MLRSRKFALSLFFLAQSLDAATILVGPPPASIQTAINSAGNGDTIQLSAGTYVEPVQVISKSLTIVGAGENTTIIQAPPAAIPLTQFFTFGSNFWCVLMVDNQAAPTPQTVNISALTVDGSTQQDTTTLPAPSPGFYGSGNRFFAIGYHEAGGTLTNIHTTNTRQSANFDELAGGGIENASSAAPVTFNVTGSLVDFYQRQGIDARGATLTANITNTTVDRGYTLTPNTTTATPNGIQFGGATTGSVSNSTISGNISTVAGSQATGIIPFFAGPNLLLSDNTFDNNDIAIAAIQNGDGLQISGNAVNFTGTPGVNDIEGIVAQDTAGLTTLTANTMTNIPGIAMDLIDGPSTDEPFQLSGNHFVGGLTGLSVTGDTTTGPQVTMSSDTFAGTTGDYITETTSPHDIWSSTQSVSFDGLLPGHMTLAEFNQILTKIFDQHNDATLGLVLDYIPASPPTITSVSPASGPVTGGNTVTITGTGFLSSNTTVNFGSTPATNVVVVSDTQITATAPASTGGPADVTVTTPFGTTPIVPADDYTYLVPGLATAFNPASIVAGATSTLTITLSNPNPTSATLLANLVDTFPANLVVAATPNAATTCSGGVLTAVAGATSITLATGAGIPAAGACTVQVAVTSAVANSYANTLAAGALQTDLGNNAAAATATLTVTPVPAPTLTAISPISGPAAGGTSVTITGTGFLAGGASVAFGASAATNVIVVSDTQITVTAPAGSGTVNVTVTTSSGTTPIGPAGAFTYIAVVLPPPTITTISPASGPAAGGTSVTITGTGFLAGGATVAFGASAATNVVVVSDTQITATAPAGSGTANVTVTTSAGTSPAVPAGAFTYFAAPGLAVAFGPASIVAGATSTLTITLSNPNATTATLSANLVDTFPANLIVAAAPNASTTCSAGALTAAAGATSVTLAAGAGIPAAGTCIVQVAVTSAAANSYVNTLAAGSLQTNVGSNAGAATATLVVATAAPAAPVPAPIDSPWLLALLGIALLGAAWLNNATAPIHKGANRASANRAWRRTG
jgi:hypothetical protein